MLVPSVSVQILGRPSLDDATHATCRPSAETAGGLVWSVVDAGMSTEIARASVAHGGSDARQRTAVIVTGQRSQAHDGRQVQQPMTAHENLASEQPRLNRGRRPSVSGRRRCRGGVASDPFLNNARGASARCTASMVAEPPMGSRSTMAANVSATVSRAKAAWPESIS